MRAKPAHPIRAGRPANMTLEPLPEPAFGLDDKAEICLLTFH